MLQKFALNNNDTTEPSDYGTETDTSKSLILDFNDVASLYVDSASMTTTDNHTITYKLEWVYR